MNSSNMSIYNFIFLHFSLFDTNYSSNNIFNHFNFFKNIKKTQTYDFNFLNTLPITNIDFLNSDYIFESYLGLRESSFNKFFITNLIDVPICFKKSKSIKFKNFEFF